MKTNNITQSSLRSPERGLKSPSARAFSSACGSLRSPERGLKLLDYDAGNQPLQVAPFAGAWIEMPFSLGLPTRIYVAPFAGAWIEIRK